MSRRVIVWLAALAAGLVTASAVVFWQDDAQQQAEERTLAQRIAYDQFVATPPPPGDLVRQISADKDQTVVVAPELADRVPADDLARARALLRDAPVPARLAFVPYPESDRGYTTSGLSAQWMEAVGVEGHYVVLWDQGSTVSTARGMDEEFVDVQTDGQPGPSLVRLAGEMATWSDEPSDAETPPIRSDNSYWGGRGGGIAAGLLISSVTVWPLFGFAWFIARLLRKEN